MMYVLEAVQSGEVWNDLQARLMQHEGAGDQLVAVVWLGAGAGTREDFPAYGYIYKT